MKVIQGLVCLFHRAERPLDLPFRSGRRAAAVVAAGEMRPDLDVQISHHLLKDVTADHRTIIQVEIAGATTEGKPLVSLGRHRVEQKLQGRLHSFAIGAVVLLVRHATAIIHHAIEHQGRLASAGIDPGRGLELFEVRGADIKLPQLIAVLRLKPNRRRFPLQRAPIQTPLLQVSIDGGRLEQPFGRLHQPFVGLQAIVFQQSNGFCRGDMPSLTIGGAQFHRGNQLQVAFQGGGG
jgi:hypothetical protein